MSDDNLITRIYSGFRGVDFRGEEINLVRSPDALNVYKDYHETDSIRTRPGMKLKKQFYQKIHGVYFYKTEDTKLMIVHSGTKLYKITDETEEVLYIGVNDGKSDSFIYDGCWYFKDGVNYLCYDGERIREVKGYVPTTSIGRKPAGGGTTYEDINLLTGKRINTFLADGESKEFCLDAQNIDNDYEPVVKVSGEVAEAGTYYVEYDTGKVIFTTAPETPLTDGQDNVSVEFKKTIEGYRDRINKCTLLQVFDNRVFFSGNPDYPNTVWHCSLNDPCYCSDLDYYNDGADSSGIKGMVAGNNALWVFKEPSNENTNVFYHTPTIDSEYGKIYPSVHSSISAGCTGKAVNFNDDIIFFSERGMEGISGDITTEQAIAHRSSMVDRKLTAEKNYEDMLLAEWEGYLMVFIDNRVYLADSRATFANENHMEYEWFYFDLIQKITSVRVEAGVLYLGAEYTTQLGDSTRYGVYTLTDTGSPVESYWVTPKDKFEYPHKLKTTNKRGCVVEATGDISVYAKTEKTDFELIGTYEGVTDYFVSRIKRKKFKDIQLKFHSDTRFSLETATLECFTGAYIKR